MTLLPTTALALIAAVYILWKGPRKGMLAFFALAPFGAAAAFGLPVLGGASILAVDIAAVCIIGLTLLLPRGLQGMIALARPPRPGFFLLCLIVFATIATAFFPRVFEGMTNVFTIARIDGEVATPLVPLGPGSGNVTQLFRLTVGAAFFFAAACLFSRRRDHGLILKGIILATLIHLALGCLDMAGYYLGIPIIDVVRTANYTVLDHHVMGGFIKRMIGGFPEATAFGLFSIGLYGFWFQYWTSGGTHRLGFPLFVLSTLMVLLSSSSSAYGAMALFTSVAVLLNARHGLDGNIRSRTVPVLTLAAILIPLIVGLLIFAYEVVPVVKAYLDQLLFNKLDSASAEERGIWNRQALRNFADTYLMGAGLGSIRASNFIVATLSNLGLLGAFFYAAFLASMATMPSPREDREPTVILQSLRAACLAILLRAIIVKATPDLGLFFFGMAGIAVGLATVPTRQVAQTVSVRRALPVMRGAMSHRQ